MTDMRPEILSLGFVQFHNTCQHLCETASDTRKAKFCQELSKLSDSFLAYDVNHLSPSDISSIKNNLDFLGQWALALDKRNGYTLSHEMRTTMDNLCQLWVKDSDKYIFAATDGDFAINRYVSSWDVLMDSIEKIYGLRFSHQLVTFTVPKHLCNDFLFVSILYHEMGHFVDNYYNISDEVVQRIKKRLTNVTEEERIRTEFFPIVQSVYDNVKGEYKDEKKRDEFILKHVGEFVSDLFGAQYVGLHIVNHIELNRHGSYDIFHETHPSPNARASLVNAFLKNDKSNLLLTDILDTFTATGLELKNRYVRPTDAANLEKGQPIAIKNDDELHSTFQLGWSVFFKGAKAMDAACGNASGTTSDYEFYLRLNEALQLSIRNYLN